MMPEPPTVSTVRNESYGPLLKTANSTVGLLSSCGSSLCNLNVDEIVALARKQTGLDDLGDGAEEHMIHLMKHMVSLMEEQSDPAVTPLARVMSRQRMLKMTTTRLRMQEYIEQHPEVEQVQVQRPIFVVGFPRAGTTVLQNLLAQHPKRRALELWELQHPVPSSSTCCTNNATLDKWKRVAATQTELSLLQVACPELDQMHHMTVCGYEECHLLMANVSAVWHWGLAFGLAEYSEEVLRSEDTMVWAYKEYKRMLQVLLHQRPAEQLVLKCPDHLWSLEALLQVFPDACIIWPHRDPASTVASYCSHMSVFRRFMHGTVDLEQLGQQVTEGFQVGVTRAMETRNKLGGKNFFDVSFQDICHNKAGVLRAIDQHFGLESVQGGWDQAVHEWEQKHRSDKPGSHIYSPAQFGLQVETIWSDFQAYMQEYGVDKENQDKKQTHSTGNPTLWSQWPAMTAATLSTLVTIAAFLICAAAGWPGAVNENCFEAYLENPNCFCERPRGDKPGDVWIAQPVNTFSNLAFVVVGLLIAVAHDTRSLPNKHWWQHHRNPITQTSLYPIAIACITCLMGPASAFLHASMTESGRVVDFIGMYLVGVFILTYSLVRWFRLKPHHAILIFGSIMACLIVWTITAATIQQNRLVFTVILMVAITLELGLRIPDRWFDKLRLRCLKNQQRPRTQVHMSLLVASGSMFGIGMAIWIPSKGGGPLCFPDSFFQGHALWHFFTAMAIGFAFLYVLSERQAEKLVHNDEKNSDGEFDSDLEDPCCTALFTSQDDLSCHVSSHE